MYLKLFRKHPIQLIILVGKVKELLKKKTIP